jgi:hypothetical protein
MSAGASLCQPAAGLGQLDNSIIGRAVELRRSAMRLNRELCLLMAHASGSGEPQSDEPPNCPDNLHQILVAALDEMCNAQIALSALSSAIGTIPPPK